MYPVRTRVGDRWAVFCGSVGVCVLLARLADGTVHPLVFSRERDADVVCFQPQVCDTTAQSPPLVTKTPDADACTNLFQVLDVPLTPPLPEPPTRSRLPRFSEKIIREARERRAALPADGKDERVGAELSARDVGGSAAQEATLNVLGHGGEDRVGVGGGSNGWRRGEKEEGRDEQGGVVAEGDGDSREAVSSDAGVLLPPADKEVRCPFFFVFFLASGVIVLYGLSASVCGGGVGMENVLSAFVQDGHCRLGGAVDE